MNIIGKFIPLKSSSEDFKKVIQIDLSQFPKPWKKSDWDLNWDHHLLYGWQVEGNVEGFALFSQIPGDDSTHLLKIIIDAKLRGTMHASLFWRCCVENLKKNGIQTVFLEVESENSAAIAFYLKSDFKVLQRIKSYYANGADALTMQLTL